MLHISTVPQLHPSQSQLCMFFCWFCVFGFFFFYYYLRFGIVFVTGFFFWQTIHITIANFDCKNKTNYLSTSRLDSYAQKFWHMYFYLFIVADISQTHAVNECVCVCYTFYLLWQFKELTEVSLIVFEAACQTSLTIHEIFFK